MTQQQRDAVDRMMRNAPLDIARDAAGQRAVFEQMLTARPLPTDVTLTPGELGGVPVLTVDAGERSTDTVLLWFHGGWYAIGSPRTSAGLSAELARRTGGRAVSVDYRLAPEHPHPAALQDALAAYRALLAAGTDPRSVVVVGESAGGGLATAALVGLQAEGLPQPGCAVLFSPWTDLTLSGASMTSKVGIDPTFVPADVQVRVADHVGAHDPADPTISPLFADLRGLPPLLVQAGSHEILLDDSTRLAANAAAADVAVTLDVTPGVPHMFQGYSALLDEGDAALSRAANFVRTHVGSAMLSR